MSKPETLPLSWRSSSLENRSLQAVQLASATYLPFANLANGISFEQFWQELAPFREGVNVVLRGLKRNHATVVSESGAQLASFSHEASLSLKSWEPSRTVRDLERRALRHCQVSLESCGEREIVTTCRGIFRQSTYGQSPLRHLFREISDGVDRVFIARWKNTRTPCAFLSLTQSGFSTFHVEQMVRSRSAPTGCMEALIVAATDVLRSEGATVLSLGETPFMLPTPDPLVCRSERLLSPLARILGASLLCSRYSYRGLFQFKQKFNPEWSPLYLCGSPSLPLVAVADLLRATGLLPQMPLLSRGKRSTGNLLNHFISSETHTPKARRLAASTLCPTRPS